jgi:hypothetical protein
VGIKDDAKAIVSSNIGNAAASKLDEFDDSDPKSFLDNVKTMMGQFLGDGIAAQMLSSVYSKYGVS